MPYFHSARVGVEATQTSVASSATSVSIVGASTRRAFVTITNDSTANLYLRLSSSAASTTSYTKKLGPGEYWDVPGSYIGPIQGIWDAVNGNARVTTGTA